MVTRKSTLPLSKRYKLSFVEGDFERLQTLFPELGAGRAIRLLVHNYIKRVEASVAPIELDLPADTNLEELLAE